MKKKSAKVQEVQEAQEVQEVEEVQDTEQEPVPDKAQNYLNYIKRLEAEEVIEAKAHQDRNRALYEEWLTQQREVEPVQQPTKQPTSPDKLAADTNARKILDLQTRFHSVESQLNKIVNLLSPDTLQPIGTTPLQGSPTQDARYAPTSFSENVDRPSKQPMDPVRQPTSMYTQINTGLSQFAVGSSAFQYTEYSIRVCRLPEPPKRNDPNRTFDLKLTRDYKPADLLVLEDAWYLFCQHPATKPRWATLLPSDILDDLCAYFQVSREEMAECENQKIAVLLQLFVAPRDVNLFLNHLRELKAETVPTSSPTYDITLPVSTYTRRFCALYKILHESVRSPTIHPTVTGGEGSDTIYKTFIKGLQQYGEYVKKLISSNKIAKLFSGGASIVTFTEWSKALVKVVQEQNRRLEELSVFADARSDALSTKTAQKREVNSLSIFDNVESDAELGLDEEYLCPITNTLRKFPCTTTCLGNMCKRPYCRNSHDPVDLKAGVLDLKQKLDMVIEKGFKFLAPTGPTSTSTSAATMRPAVRNLDR